MAHTVPKPAIEVAISVCWEGGDRRFTMAITHEAILASRPNDTLLATRLYETVRVPFEHWRKLEIKLVHLWSSGQRQEIYSHTNTNDNTTTQEEVIELLSWWQQYACIEPRSIRIELTLIIETSGVHLLPPRVTLKRPDTDQRLSPRSISPVRPPPDLESDTTFKTIVYDKPIRVDKDEDLVPQAHVVFDRTAGTWNRIVFSRPSSNW